MKLQGRFKHLFKAGNEHLLEDIQAEVDRKWERLLKLEKEFANNNDKLKKISTLKDQINEISNNIKELNYLEIQNGINDSSNYSSQTKSINNLSLIVSTLEKNFLKKQKMNDKIISKMSNKIKIVNHRQERIRDKFK